jgi:glycosyltransferase involved in cell wall biosynthesis
MSTVTCVIPAYNAERFLEETLLSVAAQRRLPDRLIILDNCSTDSTPRIVSDFRARFPKVHCEWQRNEKNVGALGNFNRALAYAKDTDFLHLLSADDLITPEFFERVVPPIERVEGRALAYSHLQFIDQQGRKLPPIRENSRKPPVEVGKRQFLEKQSDLNHLYCQSVILKTARLPSPIFFHEDWLQAADVVFFSEWALHSEKIIEVPEPLCLYRMHPQSATGGNILNLQAWVMEEWRAMQTVAKMMPPAAFGDWLGAHRRRCIFAARSKVKMQTMRSNHPDYARKIGCAALQTVGRFHWWLGNLAVVVRDFLHSFRRGQPLDKNQSMLS